MIGNKVGVVIGNRDGKSVGLAVRAELGFELLGVIVGTVVGHMLGDKVGVVVCNRDGESVGLILGLAVGTSVGTLVIVETHPKVRVEVTEIEEEAMR